MTHKEGTATPKTSDAKPSMRQPQLRIVNNELTLDQAEGMNETQGQPLDS